MNAVSMVENTRDAAQKIISDAQNQARDTLLGAQAENAQLAAEKRELQKQTDELISKARAESQRISQEMELKFEVERKKMSDYQTEIAAFKQKMLQNMEGAMVGLDQLS